MPFVVQPGLLSVQGHPAADAMDTEKMNGAAKAAPPTAANLAATSRRV